MREIRAFRYFWPDRGVKNIGTAIDADSDDVAR
jgi:hypothetical protein